jgi:hypothetical protein
LSSTKVLRGGVALLILVSFVGYFGLHSSEVAHGSAVHAEGGAAFAFIYYYTRLNGEPPGEPEMQRHFRVSAPTVHHLVVKLAQVF